MKKDFFSESPVRYAVWTSNSDGDLFVANHIRVDDDTVSFLWSGTPIKIYKLVDFVANNPKLFEAIKDKE